MPVPTPPVVVEAFCTTGAKNTIPVPSQIAVTAGAASYTDGFPPLTRIARTSGGIPPFGLDMNGILYAISAHTAAFQAGQLSGWSTTVQAAIGGYALGALVTKASGVGFWFNTVNGNTTNPDTGGAGWISFIPAGNGYLTAVPPAGSTDNYAPTGFSASTGVLDLNPSSGAATLTGLLAGYDGQRLVVSNVHASNAVTLNANSGSSSAANRFRLATDITLLQYQSLTIQYSSGAGLWISAM